MGIIYDNVVQNPINLMSYSEDMMETMGISLTPIKYLASLFITSILKFYIIFMDRLSEDFLVNLLNFHKKNFLLFLFSEPNFYNCNLPYNFQKLILGQYNHSRNAYLKHVKRHLHRCNCNIEIILDKDFNENVFASAYNNFLNNHSHEINWTNNTLSMFKVMGNLRKFQLKRKKKKKIAISNI